MKFSYRTLAIAAALSLVAISGCNKQDSAEKAAVQQQMPKTTVDVQLITLGDVPLSQRVSGRVAALESSEVRPQVSGIIEEILFQEGGFVQAGQPLYRINADSYNSAVAANEAALNQANANVGVARSAILAQQAVLEQARADLARIESLSDIDAVSKQARDQAHTNVKTAQAALQQAQANLESAQAAARSAQAGVNASRLDQGRTIVRAPISGKVGISSVSRGALVAAGQATALVTISRTDPIFVDITQTSADLLKLRQQLASGEAQQGTTEVGLTLEDGSVYPGMGRLAIANAQVNESTGSITLRAVFPNPEQILIPGMYVNAELNQSMTSNAALIPQSAVMRTPTGDTQVYVVNAANKIEVRSITTAGTHQGSWVVTAGLNNGDRLVILGVDKVKPDQEVEVRTLPNATDTTNQGATTLAPTAPAQPPQGHNSVLAPAQAGNQANSPSQAAAQPSAQPNANTANNSSAPQTQTAPAQPSSTEPKPATPSSPTPAPKDESNIEKQLAEVADDSY